MDYKKGARAYQPVSLTSIACKMLEHIYCSHLCHHIDANNVFGEANHGFRAKHSTETQLLVTSHDLLDQGKQLDILILDFSKVFDTVPHSVFFVD